MTPILIGGSLAGFNCHTTVIGHFNEVAILERDVKEHAPSVHKYAPQGHHLQGH